MKKLTKAELAIIEKVLAFVKKNYKKSFGREEDLINSKLNRKYEQQGEKNLMNYKIGKNKNKISEKFRSQMPSSLLDIDEDIPIDNIKKDFLQSITRPSDERFFTTSEYVPFVGKSQPLIIKETEKLPFDKDYIENLVRKIERKEWKKRELEDKPKNYKRKEEEEELINMKLNEHEKDNFHALVNFFRKLPTIEEKDEDVQAYLDKLSEVSRAKRDKRIAEEAKRDKRIAEEAKLALKKIEEEEEEESPKRSVAQQGIGIGLLSPDPKDMENKLVCKACKCSILRSGINSHFKTKKHQKNFSNWKSSHGIKSSKILEISPEDEKTFHNIIANPKNERALKKLGVSHEPIRHKIHIPKQRQSSEYVNRRIVPANDFKKHGRIYKR
jgi:hypothetical protein